MSKITTSTIAYRFGLPEDLFLTGLPPEGELWVCRIRPDAELITRQIIDGRACDEFGIPACAPTKYTWLHPYIDPANPITLADVPEGEAIEHGDILLCRHDDRVCYTNGQVAGHCKPNNVYVYARPNAAKALQRNLPATVGELPPNCWAMYGGLPVRRISTGCVETIGGATTDINDLCSIDIKADGTPHILGLYKG